MAILEFLATEYIHHKRIFMNIFRSDIRQIMADKTSKYQKLSFIYSISLNKYVTRHDSDIDKVIQIIKSLNEVHFPNDKDIEKFNQSI